MTASAVGSYEFRQLVMNTLTGAWGPMSNWGSSQIQSIAVLDGKTYALVNEGIAGSFYDGAILEIDTGTTDDFSWIGTSNVGSATEAVAFTIEQSYNYLDQPGRNKELRWAKPIVDNGAEQTVSFGADVDYEDSPNLGSVTFQAGVNTQKYTIAEDIGDAFSLVMEGSVSSSLSYIATTLEFNNGGTF